MSKNSIRRIVSAAAVTAMVTLPVAAFAPAANAAAVLDGPDTINIEVVTDGPVNAVTIGAEINLDEVSAVTLPGTLPESAVLNADGTYTDEFGVIFDADGNVLDRSSLARDVQPITGPEIETDGIVNIVPIAAELPTNTLPAAAIAAISVGGIAVVGAGAFLVVKTKGNKA